MKTPVKALFLSILIFSLYHLVRDILQIADMESGFTEIFHREHVWCIPYCDYVSIPLDIAGIAGPSYVLRKKKPGKTGIMVLLLFPLWAAALIIP